MGVTTERYIRKALYVDAVRVTANNFDEIVAWCQGEVETDEVPGTGTTKKFIKVRVHNPKNPRQTKAFIGDWILYTERGYKVYTNKAFRAAFDQVVMEQATAEEIREKLPLAQDKRKPLEPVIDETIANQRIPKFYIDPATGGLVETPPDADMKSLSFNELMTIIRNELVGSEELGDPEPASEGEPSLYKTLSEEVRAESISAVAEEPSQETGVQPIQEVRPGADLGTTPQGEQIEVVEATPQAIADAVNAQPSVKEGRVDPEAVIDQVQSATPPVVDSPEESTPLVSDHTPIAPVEPVSEQPPQDAAAGKYVLSEKEQADLGPDGVRELIQSGEAVLAQDLAESA